MGVSGLTTFLSRCGEKYLRKIYVSNEPVVIDGNNLMFHLYSSYDVKKYNHHLFGGDCMAYAQEVRQFFQKLKCCMIIPIVVFDGAYEAGKLKTRMKRFRQALKENVHQSTPGKSYTTALMKDIFVEVLVEQDIAHYQTKYEADDTVAFIAQRLSCPILSSDSDFFIYANVTTIPLATISFKKRQQVKQKKNNKNTEEKEEKLSTHVLEGKYITLRQMCQEQLHLSDYRLLPLTAVVIGNDQVSKSVFSNFLTKNNGNTGKGKQSRISYLINWFSKQRSYETALQTLLGSINAGTREKMQTLINEIVANYMGCGGEMDVWNLVKSSKSLQGYLTTHPISEETEVFDDKNAEDLKNEDSQDKKETLESNDEDNATKAIDDENGDLTDILCVKLDDLAIEEDSNPDDDVDEDNCNDDGEEIGDDELSEVLSRPVAPFWFLDSLYKCLFPTTVCKILFNKSTYLMPQVEVTNMPSSHAISVPIIQAIAGILYGPGKVMIVSRDRHNPVKLRAATITSLDKDLPFPCVMQSTDDFRQTMTYDKRLKILLQTLLLKPEEEQFIHEWPPFLKFWVATCVYYLRKLKKTKDLYIGVTVAVSIILCSLKSYSFPTTATNQVDSSDKISDVLKRQTLDTGLQKFFEFQSVVPNYDAKKFWRTYDMARVFFYSQFQSVLLHANTMNILLGEPLRAPKFSTLNCNLVYNVCTNVADTFGGDIYLFMNKHLEKSSSLQEVLRRFIAFSLQGATISLPTEIKENINKKRNKKRADAAGDVTRLNRFMHLEPEAED